MYSDVFFLDWNITLDFDVCIISCFIVLQDHEPVEVNKNVT